MFSDFRQISGVCVDRTVVYVNGMMTKRSDAEDSCREIEESIGGKRVYLHYNDTTSLAKLVRMIGEFAGGALGLCITNGKKSRLIVSIALLAMGFSEYAYLQQQKNLSGRNLARKIIRHLDHNPLKKVTLILHSQGADIGERALYRLKNYRDRIEVVTIGGMVTIPPILASRVENFRNRGDLISGFASRIFSTPSNGRQVTSPSTSCMRRVCHDANHYLGNEDVRRTLADMTGKDCSFFA